MVFKKNGAKIEKFLIHYTDFCKKIHYKDLTRLQQRFNTFIFEYINFALIFAPCIRVRNI